MIDKKWALVTGGLGYIGSHVCVDLCMKGFNVIAVDMLSSATVEQLAAVKKIVETSAAGGVGEFHIKWHNLALEELFVPQKCDYIIHLAAFKNVSDSVADPLCYYENNVRALITVLCCAEHWHNHPVFVFSSSATVYGAPNEMPITEDAPLNPINPYGRSKVMCEQILQDTVAGERKVISKVVLLRYFNPVGAHESGFLKEGGGASASNLMPQVMRALLKEEGQESAFCIYGTDYDTPDGTPIRDYLHVVDLAEAHTQCCFRSCLLNRVEVINLGRGQGVSVRQMLSAVERAAQTTLKVVHADRRVGDAPMCWCSCTKALKKLEWCAKQGIDDMCRSALKAAASSSTRHFPS